MLAKQTYLTLLAAATTAISGTIAPSAWCKVAAPDNIHHINQQVEVARAGDADGLKLRADETFDIDVYFHVVAHAKTEEEGYLPRRKIVEVMHILNDGYKATPFRFALKDLDYTVNTEWEPDYTLQDDYDMKHTLRRGSYRALNVYIMKDWSGGYAVLPKNVTQGDRDFVEDGVVMGPDALNHSDNLLYNQGKVLTHEAGHWLGLLHTFEGDGCDGDGDFVDDTPYELPFDYNTEPFTCNFERDSCPDQPGLDPIDNYMDYSADECKSKVTKGQIARMIDHYKTFREDWA